MAYYYVNKNEQSNGDHEVHKVGCIHIPDVNNRILLGDFSNCHDAVRAAKQIYVNSDGCYYCSNECHTS